MFIKGISKHNKLYPPIGLIQFYNHLGATFRPWDDKIDSLKLIGTKHKDLKLKNHIVLHNNNFRAVFLPPYNPDK